MVYEDGDPSLRKRGSESLITGANLESENTGPIWVNLERPNMYHCSVLLDTRVYRSKSIYHPTSTSFILWALHLSIMTRMTPGLAVMTQLDVMAQNTL
jgi:hypothetical protein